LISLIYKIEIVVLGLFLDFMLTNGEIADILYDKKWSSQKMGSKKLFKVGTNFFLIKETVS